MNSFSRWWLGLLLCLAVPAMRAQELFEGGPEVIPLNVESMYVKGMQHLARTQSDQGNWTDGYGSQPGVVGLAVLALLAHGDDPNHSPYAPVIKRGLTYILGQQNKQSGYIGSSMYNHGFATLALAEAYGAVDDEKLGAALKEAVKLILNSQAQNGFGAWRYSPTSQDADTTVSGAQMVALIAARNAGLGVPEEAIERGLRFYLDCQSGDGGFGYTTAGGSNGPRSAIGALVFALARKKSSKSYQAAMSYLNRGNLSAGSYYHYFIYYASQTFFHASEKLWEEWNRINVKMLLTTQGEDGAWDSAYGPTFGTACSLLSVALNYRYLPIYER